MTYAEKHCTIVQYSYQVVGKCLLVDVYALVSAVGVRIVTDANGTRDGIAQKGLITGHRKIDFAGRGCAYLVPA